MSLRGKLALLLMLIVSVTAAVSISTGHWIDNLLGWLVIVGGSIAPVWWLSGRVMRPIQQMLRALSGTVASYREGDFSVSLVVDRDDELGELMTAHNTLAAALL